MPQTQRVHSATGQFKRGAESPPIQLEIIDTPGLNESADQDLSHTTDVETVHEKGGGGNSMCALRQVNRRLVLGNGALLHAGNYCLTCLPNLFTNEQY